MTRADMVAALLDYFLSEPEAPAYGGHPVSYMEQRQLLHAVLDAREPAPVPESILQLQDSLLSEELQERGVVKTESLPRITNLFPHSSLPHARKLCLWQGDITRLDTDAIVNAANSAMLGCFMPLHRCIDNVIHAAAGVRLRLACNAMMNTAYPSGPRQEPVGQARITPGFNLPAKYVLHTVGPTVTGPLTPAHRQSLASSYTSCLDLAVRSGCRSVAFCCISTGVFRFPGKEAAPTALKAVLKFLNSNPESCLDTIIFNVFTDDDRDIYTRMFQEQS